MNLFSMVAAGLGLTKLTDYPAEIRRMRSQLPAAEREAFIREYKQLSSTQKAEFKQHLRQADLSAAGKMIGRDLGSKAERQTIPVGRDNPLADPSIAAVITDQPDIVQRVQRILAVEIPEIDPALVAEAAKRYEDTAIYGVKQQEKGKVDFSS